MNDDPAHISPSTRLPLVGVRLYPHQRRQLEAVAASEDATMSEVMRRALSLYVTDHLTAYITDQKAEVATE